MKPVRDFVAENDSDPELLSQAGYIPIKYSVKEINLWIQTHLWCEVNLGLDNYYFDDNTFWFNNSYDAIQFSLRF